MRNESVPRVQTDMRKLADVNTEVATRGAGHPRPASPRSAHRVRRASPVRRLQALRDRKVCQWCVAYGIGAWGVLQVMDPLREVWSWPLGLQRAITLALGLGFAPAFVIAWYHGEKGRQRVSLVEVALLVLILALSLLLISSAV